MITIFNRKELMITYSISKQADIRSVLSKEQVPYIIKVINRKSPSPFAPGSRAYTGTFGENLNLEYEYIIYVRNKDYEKASYLIKGIQ